MNLPPGNTIPPSLPSVFIMNFGILVKSDKEKISSGSKLLPIRASINTLESLIVLIPTLGVVHT